ncbi:MAG: AMP-binding protein [Fluviicola sp.]|nr:AMP-binding protein [Fluviicola sp.]
MNPTFCTEEQLKSLVEIINYSVENSPFYKDKLNSVDASFSIEDYKKLRFTSKEDLSAYNQKFCAVPKTKIAEYVTTSGTTGSPISLFLTKNDLQRLAKNEKDSLSMMGHNSDDLFQLLTTIDKQFMAGIAYFLGVQELNAGIIRLGPGAPKMQWEAILNYEPSVLIAVPSFIVTLIDYAKENNIDFENSSVQSIVCIGEPIRSDDLSYNILGKRITDNWNVKIFSTYASTEMGAAFSECTAQNGCHLNDDLLFLEVIKEDGNEALHGESGEIVVTTLGVEGTPLIRYKTGDIAKIYRDECSCGKQTPRLGPIIGRKNQMIKFKGTTLYPKAIFDALEEFEAISCYKVLVQKNELGNDEIIVLLEDKFKTHSELDTIKDRCREKLRVLPQFQFMEANKLRGLVYKKHMRKPEKIKFM